ncbi:MAG: diacylglycerol kinase family lipid kinase [Anaerolineales bacterium]|nr:diacylglycerol kinase family lipid kinase [Anaerolineales bacterium]
MTAKVILNPYSNRWNSQKRWAEAEAALKSAGVDFELVVSERKGHIIELAAQAAREKFSPIIVAGGDGSVGDAANGLMQALALSGAAGADEAKRNEAIGPLGIMPTGSANDIVYALGLPTNLNEAARVIASGKTRAMDLGKFNGKYFVNNSGAGLEPYVTIKHEKIKWIKGIARYLVAAMQAIMDKPEWAGRIKWDDDEYVGKFSFISIGNGRRTGGFFMTPHANLFDGKLTLAFGYRATRLGLFQALPRAFNEDKGSYVELDGMREVNSTKISIHLESPSPAHTDGELLNEWIQDFEYEILPKKLNVLVK